MAHIVSEMVRISLSLLAVITTLNRYLIVPLDRYLNKKMPYFSVLLLLNNRFDAAFSSRIIVVPVETLFQRI